MEETGQRSNNRAHKRERPQKRGRNGAPLYGFCGIGMGSEQTNNVRKMKDGNRNEKTSL